MFPQLAEAADASFHLFDVYYHNGMEAVMQALEETGGDLSEGQQAFRTALARVEARGTERADPPRRESPGDRLDVHDPV